MGGKELPRDRSILLAMLDELRPAADHYALMARDARSIALSVEMEEHGIPLPWEASHGAADRLARLFSTVPECPLCSPHLDLSWYKGRPEDDPAKAARRMTDAIEVRLASANALMARLVAAVEALSTPEPIRCRKVHVQRFGGVDDRYVTYADRLRKKGRLASWEPAGDGWYLVVWADSADHEQFRADLQSGRLEGK